VQSIHALATQAFSRAAGAQLIQGNSIRLLEDARENYPAWLDAIAEAKHHVHFESYLIHEDETGELFANALIAKAREGVKVRLIYDWMGGLGKASGAFWARLRAAGVLVHCHNPPRLSSPLGWLSRDHRKTLSVDGRVGVVTGLCVGHMWVGDAEKQIAPWRDTGVLVHGPAVADIERAFADIWATEGDPIPADELVDGSSIPHAGNAALRVVATSPATAGMFRVDQLVATLAKKRLWLADAYFAGTTAYVQALCAAAKDGVDVRLLVPNASDIPLLKPLSRAGYRPLLQAGVRIFEWNGTMMHAKTAVADARWARVGSTNLNIASWFGNYEMDIVAEDVPFARSLEQAYMRDLEQSTEVVLNARRKLHAPAQPRPARLKAGSGAGSVGPAAAGVLRIGNAVGAAFANRRVLEPVEARISLLSGAAALLLAVLIALFPRVLAYPSAVALAWMALTLLYRGYRLRAITA
jgi:cardiolipin synthase A/B